MRFEIRFEGSVRVHRSQMRRKGIPKSQHVETTRGKSNVDTKLGKEIEKSRAKLTCRKPVKRTSGRR